MTTSSTPYINRPTKSGITVRIPVANVDDGEYKRFVYTKKVFLFSRFETHAATFAAAEAWRDANILKDHSYNDRTITGNNGGLVRRDRPRLRSNDLPVGIVDSRGRNKQGVEIKLFSVKLQCVGAKFGKTYSYGGKRTRTEALRLARLKRKEFLDF